MLATIAQVRAAVPDSAATDADVTAAITLASELLQRACGVAFEPIAATETISGRLSTFLGVGKARPISASSLTIDGTVTSVGSLYAASGGFYLEDGFTTGFRNVVITYTHGYSTCPALVNRAVTRAAADYLTDDPSNFWERASTVNTDEGTYSLATPGVGGVFTSIPEVNAVIALYKEQAGVIF